MLGPSFRIWDRLIMGEFELFIFTLISLFEHFKEEHLNSLIENNNNKNYSKTENITLIKKFGIDQSKILRKSAEYYNNFQNNHQNIYSLIINYFNK